MIRSWSLPLLLVAAVAGFAIWSVSSEGDDPRDRVIEPLDISASGPRFDTVEARHRAADVVVEGRIVGADVGRVFTDPATPDAGFTTRLFRLDVTQVVKGEPGGFLIVEQESALLDGTPITIDGAPRLVVGDTGTFSLVHGTTDELPYLALVDEHGFEPAGP